MISGRVAVTFAVLFAGACSSPETNGVVVTDAGPTQDAATSDADPANDATAPGTCEGTCKTTALTTDFGGKTRVLARAQFGTEQGDAGAQLHTESHLGGSAACPTQTSPTPDYTLIVTGIPRGAVGRKLAKGDGVTSAFFDFKGDLGLPALTKATSVSVTVIGEDPTTPPKWVAFDVEATFSEGTVKGHAYAEYCASLSE